MNTKLAVNIDHIATIRQARLALEPDPVAAAFIAETAGAHGITIHLRSDRRHIKDRDLVMLRETVKTRLNVEMATTKEMIAVVREARPDAVTLVPESPEELTTEGGLNVVKYYDEISRAIEAFQGDGINVSLFIDPDEKQIDKAIEVGASMIELNTAAYAEAVPAGLNESDPEFTRRISEIKRVTSHASRGGLRVLAGHGLTYRNVYPVSSIPEMEELNIGHNIIAMASLVGLEQAVKKMLEAMNP
ncbi:MAG: pyridoxine 5'-phosphate synthase [Anaerolineales bacterium]|nr:pyridoxine 5'-phosphate synthase [Anaerolineales bacterium]